MSLPECARFFNIYGDYMGYAYVNVGWFMDNRPLARILVERLPTAALENPNIHYVELYDFSFPIEMVNDMRKAGLENATELLVKFKLVETVNEEYYNEKSRL